jgi:hypothetical protein
MYETLKTTSDPKRSWCRWIRGSGAAKFSADEARTSHRQEKNHHQVGRKTHKAEASACPARPVATLLALQADLPTMMKKGFFLCLEKLFFRGNDAHWVTLLD